MAINFFKIFKGLSLKPQSSAPTVNVEDGDVYYDSSLNTFRGRANSSWEDMLGGGGSGGTGGINYVENPNFETDTSGWVANEPEVSVTRTTTSGDLPREDTTGTGGLFAASGATSGDHVAYAYTLDSVDSGQRMQVSFDYKPKSGYSDGDFEVILYDVDDSAEISLDSPELLANTSSFQREFYSTGSNSYELRVQTAVANSNGIVVSNVKVAPQSDAEVQQGAPIVSMDLSSDITIDGVTESNMTAKGQRVGDWLYVRGSFTASVRAASTFSLELPAGITLDTSVLSNSQTALGNANATMQSNDISVWGNTNAGFVLFYDGSDTDTLFFASRTGNPNFEFQKDNASVILEADGVKVSFEFRIPVEEWQGSTTGLANNRVEFLHNDDSATGVDSTADFAYGAAGQAIVAISKTNDTVSKRVRAVSAYIESDVSMLQVSPGNNKWVDADDLFPYTEVGSAKYGMKLANVSANNSDMDVVFGGDGANPTEAWSSYTSYKWRLVKSTNPLAVESQPATADGYKINYITNNDFESDITGWNEYNDGASSSPVDGTGGVAGTLTSSRTTNSSEILRDGASLKVAKTDEDAQGEGVSYDFSIDKADENKRLSVQFEWLTSANYEANDMGVYVYDVDNAALILPSVVNLPATAATSQTIQVFFNATDSTNYRLCFHVQDDDELRAWDFYLDNVVVGPQDKCQTAPISDWTSYTAIISGYDTISAQNLEYRRVGDNIEIRGDFTTGASPTATEAQIGLPSGLTVGGSTSSTVNCGTLERDVSTAYNLRLLCTKGEAYLNVGRYDDTSNTLTPLTGLASVAATQRATVWATAIPIAEWAGSSQGLANNRVEYAFNTDTSDADDTTSFAYGPSGQEASYTFSAVRNKRVRFLSPIQVTDKITLEVSIDREVWNELPYIDASNNDILAYDGSTNGAAIRQVSGSETDVDVRFLRYPAGTTNWTTNTIYWRVSKSSNPLAVEANSPDNDPWHINYISKDNFDAEKGVTAGWHTYADTAQSTPVDGVGGSPADVSISASQTNAIRGSYSFRLAKAAADGQGEGWAYDISIDDADKGKQLYISFDVDASHADYDSGDVGVYIYDVDNATLLTPSFVDIASANYEWKAGFVATDSSNYRLIFHVATTNADDWEIYLDRVKVGPQEYIQATPISDWTSYDMVPDSTNSDAAIDSTPAINNAQWKRVGDTLRLRYELKQDSAGTTGTGTYLFPLPDGLTIDTSKASANGDSYALGAATVYNSFNGFATGSAIAYDSANLAVMVGDEATAPALIGASWHNFGNTDLRIGFEAIIPISEWAGSSVGLANSRVEFVWNSDNDGSANTIDFAYGPSGVLFPNRAAGTSVTKRVRFLTPIQSTDIITIQVFDPSNNSGDEWTDAAQRFPKISQNAGRYGIQPLHVSGSNTDLDIVFQASGADCNSTYGANGTSWAALSSTWKWRVVKSSNPISVASKHPGSFIHVNTGSNEGSSSTHIRYFTNIVSEQGDAITVDNSSTLGTVFTINESGVYAMDYVDGNGAAGGNIGISVNAGGSGDPNGTGASELTTNVVSITSNRLLGGTKTAATGSEGTCSATALLNAGDIIRPHTDGTMHWNVTRVFFRITQVFPTG